MTTDCDTRVRLEALERRMSAAETRGLEMGAQIVAAEHLANMALKWIAGHDPDGYEQLLRANRLLLQQHLRDGKPALPMEIVVQRMEVVREALLAGTKAN